MSGGGAYERLSSPPTPSTWATMRGAVSENTAALRERLVQTQLVHSMLANRTNIFFVGAFAVVHCVGFVLLHFVWSTANFHRAFLVGNVALAGCACVAVLWISVLAPRWFRPAAQTSESSATARLSEDTDSEAVYPAQCEMPARGSTESNVASALCVLCALMVVLMAFALRQVRGLVTRAPLIWLSTILPVILLLDFLRHRWALLIESRIAGGGGGADNYTVRFPVSNNDGGGSVAVVRTPWLAYGNVPVLQWRIGGVLVALQAVVMLSCVTFQPLPPSGVNNGAAFGYALGVAILLGCSLMLVEHHVTRMRSSNLVCLVGFVAAALVAPFTIALDRGAVAHSPTEAPDVHRFEHAGLLAMYLLMCSATLYAYAVLGLQVLRRIGTVHIAVVIVVSLAIAHVLGSALTGHVEYIDWIGPLGCLALLALSAAYLYACVVAQLRPVCEYAEIQAPAPGSLMDPVVVGGGDVADDDGV